jgi:hypothetical protein
MSALKKIYVGLRPTFTGLLIDGLSAESKSIDFDSLVSFIEDPNVSFNLLDESRRTLVVRLLLDATMFDRLTFDQFDKVYEKLKETSGLSFTGQDIIGYFSSTDNWNIAAKLVQLITRDVFKCPLNEQVHLFKLIQCRSSDDRLVQLHFDVAAIAEKDSNIVAMLIQDLGNIIECDYHVLYSAICKNVFAMNFRSCAPDLSNLYMSKQRCVRPKPGSKCGRLMSTTIMSVIEGISREEYLVRLAEVMGTPVVTATPMVTHMVIPVVTPVVATPVVVTPVVVTPVVVTPAVTPAVTPTDKTAQIESALNIIEMVSNDIAALSLEAERINTCVRDAKATLM